MESDKQRLYSVLTRTEVMEKMMKEIVQISEVFSLSQSDATVTLIRLGWNSFKASDLLGDNKEKFLAGLGLVQVSGLNQTDGEGDNLVSTPFCSHKFCSDCWRDHLRESLEDKKDMISCLNQDCVASVGPDVIEKLEDPVKEMYERYVLGSFMESNKIKWCPAKGCEYAIERHEDVLEDGGGDDESGVVVCLCGYTFCWMCKVESHRPVTCNNASLWLSKLLGEAKTLGRFATKSKPCPNCQSHVKNDSNDDWRIVTCVCSYAFCWHCLGPEEAHTELYSCTIAYVPPPCDEASLLRHLTLWEVRHEAMEKAKRDLEAIELHSIPVLTGRCGLGELDMKAVREACMLIIQCRLVLKWSSVFGYFISDYHSAKKQYLDHLVEEATANLVKHEGSVHELIHRDVLAGWIFGFRHKLEASTTATGNYFHSFVKAVEDGLCEVKDGVYENVPTDYWFCDRCTFQNDSFEQKCRVCVFPFEGPSLKALGINNNNSNSAVTAAANQQEALPYVSSSNPFATPPRLTFDVASNPFECFPFEALGSNNSSAGAQGVQMLSSNPFGGEGGGTSVFGSAPLVGFGNNNSAHQQQVANSNPFATGQGGTNLLESGPVAFGSSAANNPFARPGGTNPLQTAPPFVGFGNNNGTASGHQQQAPSPLVALVKEEPSVANSIERE